MLLWQHSDIGKHRIMRRTPNRSIGAPPVQTPPPHASPPACGDSRDRQAVPMPRLISQKALAQIASAQLTCSINSFGCSYDETRHSLILSPMPINAYINGFCPAATSHRAKHSINEPASHSTGPKESGFCGSEYGLSVSPLSIIVSTRPENSTTSSTGVSYPPLHVSFNMTTPFRPSRKTGRLPINYFICASRLPAYSFSSFEALESFWTDSQTCLTERVCFSVEAKPEFLVTSVPSGVL